MLVNALLDIADKHSRKPAFEDEFLKLDYGKLVLVSRVISEIVSKETKSDRVGIVLPCSAFFPATFFGILWSGKIAIPLNFLLNEAELKSVIEDSGIDLILSVRYFKETLSEMPVRTLFLEDLHLKRKAILSKFRRMHDPKDVTAEETAVILYTSGTDGLPKGVELSHGNLLSNARDCITTARIESDHKLLNILPPFHVFGLTANFLVTLILGASSRCLPRFQPANLINTIQEYRPSVLMAIPSMFAAMFRMRDVAPDTYKSLYLTIAGGEPLHENLEKGYAERYGLTIYQGYGLTETSPVLTLNLPWANCPGSVGKPIDNVEIRIADDDGNDVPPGEVGEICARTPGLMKGYYKRPVETAEVMREGNWFRTGDLGQMDLEGYIHITGRQKDMIIVGGENVYPKEIETVLLEHEAVSEAAVIGRPDSSRGEVPIAFVIMEEGGASTERELRSYAGKHLAGHKVPKEVHIRTDLPRGPTGKIHKRILRQEL